MALPPEKISELKQIIHSQLSQMDVQGHIKEALSEVKTSNRENIQQVDLLNALREKGFIDDVMKQLKFDSTASTSANVLGHHPKPATHFTHPTEKVSTAQSVKTANVDPTRRYLFVQILGGKAFLEHLQEPESLPGHAASYFTLHLHFRGQRFKSRPVGCACEPDIQEGFLLELHKDSQGKSGDASRMANATTLLSLCDPVHLVLIKTDQSGDSSIVSSHNMEWRSVLSSPNSRCTNSVELMGIGSENQVPVGLLETKLELIPKLSDSITDEVISAQVGMEKARKAEKERLFLVYAKQWWQEYLQIRSSHKDRLVKIFAQDENGANRPVCSYVKPMRAGRLLDMSRQAARFCSLIGYEKVAMVGGGKAEQWSAMHTFLSRNKGDCEDHCNLLCSLLLGFGLDAYICIGTKNKGAPHAWVVTLDVDGSATFWESLTGNRYLHHPVNPNDPPSVPQPQNSYPYRTIGCVFNHNAFFGNCQPLDSVEVCQFHLRDEALWKAMSEDAIASVCGPGSSPLFPQPPPLCANSLDAALVSNSIEQELRALVTEHRRNQGLSTVWDDHLSYLLTPALAAYETERVTEVSCGNSEFQQAIRRAVPDGHTFKGYPIQFVHCNSRRAFNACLRSNVCEEIINCRGDHVRLAVRAKVFLYPENASATWIMFATKYKSVL
ncbi:hypothetical protein CAPTEDRAFT_130762 [Capitella teleta]|uniref:Centrosomal protein of 76 kDa n=1 Tax=Capitella teleta TaxID=283909 RepID=R7THK5_CAPTE|nr:hypothetical protein CAPTEDRAFT_130762 [Capitella teleta]|eukprot:ELT93283.1 hypothetical protein CAPTEDRAFT_130762 [Capitella teleta]